MAMPPADYGKVLLAQSLKPKAVGDPTLWGAAIGTPIDIISANPATGAVVANTQPRVIQGAQILQTKTTDAYARSWSLSGTVAMPAGFWDVANTLDPKAPMFPDPNGTRDDKIEVWLEITQGVGQASITQLVLLSAGATSQGWGLIQQQAASNNGPYGEVPFFPTAPPAFNGLIALNNYTARSFAMIGALIGNQIAVRAIYSRGGVLGQPPNIPMIVTTLVLTPYAPGDGI